MKKNGRRLGATLLALAMIFSLVPTAALAARTEDEIALDAPGVVDEAPAGALDINDPPAQLLEVETPTGIPDSSVIDVSAMELTAPTHWGNESTDKMLDGDGATHYSSTGIGSTEEARFVQIRLTSEMWVSGLYWMNRADDNNGVVKKYAILASPDGTNWYPVTDNRNAAEGDQWSNGSTWRVAAFPQPIKSQYIKLLGVDAKNNYISGAEVRLATPTSEPATRTVSGTAKDTEGNLLEGVKVSVGGYGMVTGSDGQFSFANLIADTAYTLTASKTGYADSTVEIAADATADVEVSLQKITRTISGTITSDGSTAVEGATVTLVGAATGHYPAVANVSAQTDGDGHYSLDVISLAAGTYHVRVAKPDRGAKIVTDSPVTLVVSQESSDTTVDAQLPAYDDADYISKGYSIKSFDFTDGIPEITNGFTSDDASEMAKKGTASHADGQLVLSFTEHKRNYNLMRLANTPLKNGEVEFDATRTTDNVYFGLGLRVGAGKNEGEDDFARWLYVGLFAANGRWGYEYWNDSSVETRSFWSQNYETNTPSFKAGETRHIKVRLEDTTLSLWVDGVTVLDAVTLGSDPGGWSPNEDITAPIAAGDAGFLYGGTGKNDDGCGSDGDTIKIDNLRVVRFDSAYEVHTGTASGGSLTITTAAPNAEPKPLPDDKRVPAGDTVIIAGTPDNADADVLDSVTVTERTPADGEVAQTVTATKQPDGSFIFSMPQYAVTVTGTFLPKVTAVTLDKNTAKVGQTIEATAKAGDTTITDGVAYQWYRLDNGTWLTCDDDTGTSKIRTVTEADIGKTLKVEVKGTGNTYASTVTQEATTSGTMTPADAVVESITTVRKSITFIMNGEETNENQTSIGGTTTTLTLSLTTDPSVVATEQGQVIEDYTVEWASSDEDKVTVTGKQDDPLKADVEVIDVTEKDAPVTITATLTRTNAPEGEGKTKTTTCNITVKKDPKGITVKKDGVEVTEPVVVYANGTGNSITLTGEITPEGAEGKINWFRADGQTPITTVNPSTDGTTLTITANSSATAQKLGKVIWWASLGNDNDDTTALHTEFVVHVIRKLDNEVTWTDAAQAKVDGTLSVQTDALKVYANPNSSDEDSGKEKLTYTWYALASENASIDDEDTVTLKSGSGSNYKTHTLTSSEYNKFIKVVVSAPLDTENNFFYTGSVETPAVKVVKGTGPAAPTNLEGVNCATEANDDGKIKGLVPNTAYEVSKKSDGDSWGTHISYTADDEGYINGLANGIYVVRIPESAHYMPGANSAPVAILEFGANAKQITHYTSNEGRVTVTTAKVDPGTPVTMTVEPATGWQLKKGTTPTVAYTDEPHTPVDVSPVEGQAGKFSFTMPDAAVTITAEFERLDLTITHDLGEGLTCDLGDPDEANHTHTVKYGENQVVITITADASHAVGKITVVKTGGDALGDNYFILGQPTDLGTATITFPNGIKDNLTIKVVSEARKYLVTADLTNVNIKTPANTDDRVATHGQNYTTVIEANSGYELPATITVTREGTTGSLTVDTDYTYDRATGTVVINAAATTGALHITAVGVEIKTPLTSASIEFSHNVSTVPAGTPPHVGDTLTAKVDPENATADYQWQRAATNSDTAFADISGAKDQTYQLTGDDKDKFVRVVITGTGKFEGTKKSDAVGKIGATAASSITLSQTSATVVFGQKITLSVTAVTPAGADPTVTWDVRDNPNVVSVNATTGEITPLKVGAAVVRATAASGVVATCNVTVTPAPIGVTLQGTPQVGETLTAKLSPTGITANDLRSVQWYRGSDPIDNATGLTYELTNDDAGHLIKVIVTAASDKNYTGTADATTASVVAGGGSQLEKFSITIVSDHGTVTADPTEASVGATVTLTVTPSSGYKLVTLTVAPTAGGDSINVDETDNSFIMPNGAVTVTATYQLDKAALENKIDEAETTRDTAGLQTKPDGTVAADVDAGVKFITQAEMTALENAITAAEAALGTVATPTDVTNAVKSLDDAVKAFTAAIKTGTKGSTPVIDKTALTNAIAAANAAKEGVVASTETDPANVAQGTKFTTQAAINTLTAAINTATAALDTVASEADVTAAVNTLNGAVTTFNNTVKTGTKPGPVVKYTVTVTAGANGTARADKTANVAAGEKVTLTITPAAGYEVDEITITDDLTLASDNSFTMPAKNVTVNVTFKAVSTAKKALADAITAATALNSSVQQKPEGTEPSAVSSGTKFTTDPDAKDTLTTAINTAKGVLENEESDDAAFTDAKTALDAAVAAFNEKVQTGTKRTSSSSSSSSTATVTNPDGSKTTTVTKPDGSKTVTTESPDGSKEVVETKKDGTVTETVTDPEGAKTETVTTPAGDKAITVTDAQGEELAKVEIPAQVTPAEEEKFDDLGATAWAEESILKVAGLGLVDGVGEKKYAPAVPMTRGALATVLHRLSQGKSNYNVTFQDVAQGKYYTEGVAWAAKAGVVKGLSEDIFAPDQNITREQLAVMLARYAKLIGLDTAADAAALDAFVDADKTGDWAVDGMAWCVKAGILQGKGESVLDPAANVSRAEVATMLDRFIDIIMK